MKVTDAKENTNNYLTEKIMRDKMMVFNLEVNGVSVSIAHIPVDNPKFKLDVHALQIDFENWIENYFMVER